MGKCALLVSLWLVGTSTQVDEKFIPPTFAHATVIACGVGGGVDGSAEAFAVVKYGDEHLWQVTIAKRESAWEGLQDCVEWIKTLKGPIYDAAKRQSQQ